MLYANYVRNKMRHLYKPIIAEAEGVPCVLEYSKGKYMKNYGIYGNSIQNGTPSPENPVEIQSVGNLVIDEASEHYGKYDIPITVAGKNLIPYPYYYSTKTLYGITFTDNNGVITLDGTTTLSETGIADFKLMSNAKLEAGTYTLSGCPKTGATYTYRLFVMITHNDNTSTYANDIGNGSTFTVADTDLFTISIRIGGQLGTVSNLVFKPQLEKGSSATEYEPYRGIETTHIYLDEPLRKVGDYSDYVDFKKQKVVRNIKEITLNGSENWRLQGINENGIISFIYAISNETAPSTTSISALSTHYSYKTTSFSNTTEQGFFVQRGDITNLYIRMFNEEIVDIAAFKTWLSKNKVKVYYQMATPTEEPISLPTLQTFKGTTIMSVDTTVLPSNIKVTYVRT